MNTTDFIIPPQSINDASSPRFALKFVIVLGRCGREVHRRIHGEVRWGDTQALARSTNLITANLLLPDIPTRNHSL
jgi:hypothetical protein